MWECAVLSIISTPSTLSDCMYHEKKILIIMVKFPDFRAAHTYIMHVTDLRENPSSPPNTAQQQYTVISWLTQRYSI